MQRRKFGREFKVEALRLIRARGVRIPEAARDLDVHQMVLHRWVKQAAADPKHAFPGHRQMRPEQAEINRLRNKVVRLRTERDILKMATAFFARDVAREVRFRC